MMELQYEPHAAGRPVVVEYGPGVTRIIVQRQGLYVGTPHWVRNTDVFSVVLVPLWWVGALVVRTLLRLPKPPRAVFEVSADRLKMTLHEVLSEDIIACDWPRAAIVDIRPNRFEAGLWVHVTGFVKETYLADQSPDVIEKLAEALQAALAAERCCTL